VTKVEIWQIGFNLGIKELEFTNQWLVRAQISIIFVFVVILGLLSHQSANAIPSKVNIIINTTSSIIHPSTNISNAYMYLNTTDGHYHVTGIIKNIVDETIDDTSVFGTFFDMATNTLIKSIGPITLKSLDPGQSTTFDIDTGYTSKQANKFPDMMLQLQ
jgi:hypothetical protein